MKTLLLIGVSVMALAETSAEAVTTFNYTAGFQTFTAPVAGTYMIDAYGARGGNGESLNGSYGGGGAGVGGVFALTAGEVIDIAVGGAGQGK